MTNNELVDEMMQLGTIRVSPGPIYSDDPPPLAAGFDWDRIEGMMLGLAIGDALGNTTEGQIPDRRRERHGEIRDYLPNRYAGDRPVGVPSDDSQMAFWTVEQLVEDGRLLPERLVRKFANRQIFGMGGSVRVALDNLRQGRSWYECGVESAGNGALMRIAPVVIPHLRQPAKDLWVDATLAGVITHNDSASISSCVAFVAILWDLLGMDRAPKPEWWVERYIQVARPLETEAKTYPVRGGEFEGWRGKLSDYVEEKVPAAWDREMSALDACNSWYSAAYLLETVPCVLYILMKHADDPEEAIVRAVNDTKDNDSVAAIVGAAVGALHGKKALPKRWLEDLTGRTGADDDGRMFQLLDMAREKFWQ